MEEAGIFRETVNYKKPEAQGYGAEADEKTAETPVHEELLKRHYCLFFYSAYQRSLKPIMA